MAQTQRRLSELTVDEFITLIRATVRDVLEEERQQTGQATNPQAGLLDIPPVSLGGLKPGARLISREE